MKGPFERLKYDLRRIWECPQCGAKQRSDGTVTTRFCQCGKPNTNPLVAMKLVSDGPRRMVPPIARPVIEAASEVIGVTQVDVLAVASVDLIAMQAEPSSLDAAETELASTETAPPPVDPPGPVS